jgi:hypothetical protein
MPQAYEARPGLAPNCRRISPNNQVIMLMISIVDEDVARSDLAFDPVNGRLDRHLVRDIEGYRAAGCLGNGRLR